MIAAIIGPSGSDRRMYNLIALALVLAPLGTTLAGKLLPESTSMTHIITGATGASLLVCMLVLVYGSCSMMIKNIKNITQQNTSPAGNDEQSNWNTDLNDAADPVTA